MSSKFKKIKKSGSKSKRPLVQAPLVDWKDSIIYFILIDRFCNGDPTNDDFGKGEFNPKDDEAFHGGDLKGILKRLPYIKSLGFDAIWITPPVHNQWINAGTTCRGYHGYWAYDFTEVDPHFGVLADFKNLVDEAHRLGIRVIQDIVVNHTGNYFTIDPAKYDPKDPTKAWQSVDCAFPPEGEIKAPKDPVFGMNNPNIAEHREAAVYNFTPPITHFKDREETLKFTLADLDDVNLESPVAANRMTEIYREWIDKVGIDGFRIDTVYYTPEKFYEGFCHSREVGKEGVKVFAKQKGNKDFFVFGEAWTYDYQALNGYIRGEKGESRLDSAIDFPLNDALVRAFFKKESTQVLADSIRAHKMNAPLWVNFLDNHDVERMWGRANAQSVRQALVALFTLPGIPCIYYGTECGFTKLRENMFSPKNISPNSPHARFLKQCIELRKANPAFSRGKIRVLKSTPRSGVFAYERAYKNDEFVVLFNTSSSQMFFELPDPQGAYQAIFSDKNGKNKGAVTGHLSLEPESFMILKKTKTLRTKISKKMKRPELSFPKKTLEGTVKFNWNLGAFFKKDIRALYLLPNSDLQEKIRVGDLDAASALLDTRILGNGSHTAALLVELKNGKVVSSREQEITVCNPYVELVSRTVTSDEARALTPSIHMPTEKSYSGQCLIQKATLLTSGKDIQLRLTMDSVTNDWNPPVGFDHLYLHVFFELPKGKQKAQEVRKKSALPMIGYNHPDMQFDIGFLIYGWEILSFGSKDSTESSYGKPLLGTVKSEVDLENREIRLTFSKEYFPSLRSFDGLKAFVTTWDGYLGKLREIAPKKDEWEFSVTDGSKLERLAKIYSAIFIKN